MGVIVPIVEGDGEVEAVPNLLNRLLKRHGCYDLFAAKVMNAHGRNNITKPEGIEKFVRLALKRSDCEGVLVLLDADRDCAYNLSSQLAWRVLNLAPSKPVVVVAAKCEYEAWFLASLHSITGQPLDGRPGLRSGISCPDDNIEAIFGVKKWLSDNFPRNRIYKETLDQYSMTKLIDLNLALPKSRSLRRLDHAISELINKRNQIGFVSPI